MLTVTVDLARSRFSLSRLAELSCALEVLTHPERAPFARRWVTATRFDPADAPLVHALVEHDSRYVPDFLVPKPAGYEPTLDEELAAVAATPDDVVRHQLELTFGGGPLPPVVRGTAALAERAAAELRYCWDVVLAPTWPDIRRVLDEDVRHRTSHAGRTGFGGLLDGLHPALAWDGELLTMTAAYELAAGPGLVLVPSVFLPKPAVWAGQEDPVLLGYPARGRGRVWSTPAPILGPPVLGERRTALLADLDLPRSTSELAERHHLSPATVSYHLTRLRAAGLVTSRQDGHRVLYRATERAAALLG